MKAGPPAALVGCCGFRRSQSDYFSRFSLVEVQHTFYQPPQIKTLERWRADAPVNFEFTVKAWQLITHEGGSPTYKRLKRVLSPAEQADVGAFKPTSIVAEALETTIACAQALRADKILFQCPPRFTPEAPNIARMRAFFSKPRPRGYRYLWEPRGNWPEALIRTLCDELSLIHVVNPFTSTPVTSEFYYFRLHGRRGQQHYDAAAQKELLETVLSLDAPAYVLFNNVRMLEDAEAFQRRLRRTGDSAAAALQS